jgi:outer membrane protein
MRFAFPIAGRPCLAWVVATVGAVFFNTPSQAEQPAQTPRSIKLDQCIELALRQNRELQIERLNPAIAEANLSAGFGYYDPFFIADVRHENASDTGGFDPADFSRDAIYSAKSDTARLGLTGFLPTGLSYSLTGSYANSFGERNGLNFDSYSVVGGITVRQPLLRNFWIDPGRLIIRVNRKLLQITELGVTYLALDVINRVQQAYYELLYAYEHRQVQLELLASRQRTLAGLERQVEQGVLTETGTLPARSQLAAVETLLAASSNAVVLAENNLRILLGEDLRNQSESPLQPVERLWVHADIFNLDESWRRGLAQRPDLLQLRADVERGELDLKFRRNQLFPSLDLVAGYGRRGASTAQLPPPLTPQASADAAFDQWGSGSAPSEMVGVIFSLPLARTSERANYRASRHAKAQAELRLKQKEELVLREISDAVRTARLSFDRVRAAERASAFAAQAVDAEERKLAGGESNIFFVLQYQNDLLTARTAELRAKADYLKAVSQAWFADASLLERRGVSIEIE